MFRRSFLDLRRVERMTASARQRNVGGGSGVRGGSDAVAHQGMERDLQRNQWAMPGYRLPCCCVGLLAAQLATQGLDPRSLCGALSDRQPAAQSRALIIKLSTDSL